jgi:transcriptional regulator with XRE-family HTH domain
MTVGEKIKQIRKDKGLQQKTVATDVGLDQSNYNKVENGKREPSVEILQKLAVILDVTVDELLNSENKMHPTPVTVEDKTVSEKIRLVEQLEEEDKNVIYRMLDTMLTKKKFQDFFHQNLQTSK